MCLIKSRERGLKFTLPDSVADPAEQVFADGLGHAIASLTRQDDPLRKLLDPEFLEVLWEYENSRTEPLIPGSLHEKQDEFLEDDAKHRWLFGGNQSGKTTIGAVDLALTALGRHPLQLWDPPVTLWASALTWELWEQILLPELLTWIPPDRVIDAPAPNSKSTKRIIQVRADNGEVSRIVGKSAEQGAQLYQSARVHKVWFDEEHPLSIWREVLPRLLRFGGTTLGTMTPLMGLTWIYWDIYEPWKRGQTVDHFCLHVGLADNPGVDPENIEALKRELVGNPSELEARLHGYFMRPTGLALQFDPNKHFDSEWDDEVLIDTMQKQSWEQFCGIDFGAWRFAFIHNAADRAKRVHVIAEYFSQKESLETRAKYIHKHLTRYKAPKNVKIAGDSANPQDIMEINKELGRLKSLLPRLTRLEEERRGQELPPSRCHALEQPARAWRVSRASQHRRVPIVAAGPERSE